MKPDIHRLRRTAALGLIAAGGVLALPASVLAAPAGTPDGSFGSGGSAVGAANVRLMADAVQANGDTVAVGEAVDPKTAAPVLYVQRLTPAGTPDPSFGSGGAVLGPALSGSSGSVARAVTVQANGDIVVVGQATGSGGVGNAGMVAERFTPAGTLDPSFGSGGIQDIQASNHAAGNAVALASNGDILVGGSVDLNAVPYAAVTRLSPSGALDSTFGSLGTAILQLGQYATVRALAPLSNGEMIIGGNTSPDGESTDGLVAKVTATGTLDTSFNGSGAQVNQFAQGGGAFSSVNGVTVAANGTVYAAGNATGANEVAYTFITSYTASGAKNSGFGSGGVTLEPSAKNWVEAQNVVPGANSLIALSNGSLVAAGEYDNSTGYTYGTLWAFTPSGQPDPSFGSNGVQELRFANQNNSSFEGVTASPTPGDIVAAGTEGPLGGTTSALVTADAGPGSGTTPKPPVTPPSSTPFRLTVRGTVARASVGKVRRFGLRLLASCDQGCRLSVTLTTPAGTAHRLGVKTRVWSCRKVRGRERCSFSERYVGLRLQAFARLGRAGTHTFVLRLSKALANDLARHPGSRWTLTVLARPTARGLRTMTFRRSFQFIR